MSPEGAFLLFALIDAALVLVIWLVLQSGNNKG